MTAARATPRMIGTALGAGAAGIAWLAVLVVLNLTVHPAIAAGAFAGLAVLCWTTPGCRRVLVVALLIGIGMCVAVPGVGFADGSLRFAFANDTWVRPEGGAEWLAAFATTLRVPAQVLAIALIVRVPGPLLLAGVARVSRRGALMAGLASRLGPLLRRDVATVRDELLSRGVRFDRGIGVFGRIGAAAALWEALVTGLFDRAFATAAALRVRGYGAAQRATTAPLTDPRLTSGVWPTAGSDLAVVALAIAALVLTVFGRATGLLVAPTFVIFGGANEPLTALSLTIAIVMCALGALPVLVEGRDARRTRTADATAAPGTNARAAAALVVDDVSVTHSGATAPVVRSASLRVAPGELVVLIGASGSGKSTLLDAITGIAPNVTGGERRGVIRLGELVLRGDASSVGHVAAVFQLPETQLVVGTVAEEVAFGLRHAGCSMVDIEHRTVAALDALRIMHLAHRDCATLSGGELQRVLLAAALALRPQLLVLDEPTSQIDAASAQAFWEAVDLIRSTHRMGVLVAEHRLQHVLLHADRVVSMVNGSVVDCDRESTAIDRTWGDLHPPRTVFGGARLDVQLERLTAGPHATTIQRELCFAVPAGAIVTVEGRNGTGKSTLLRTIRGLQTAHGVIRIDGMPRSDVASSVRLFGWLAQGISTFLPGATVEQAACAIAVSLGVSTDRALRAVVGAGFEQRLDEHPSTLSVGERQRLAFVAMTSHGAPIWLLDEPTRGMDAIARRWMASHLYEHSRHGGVAVIATHDPAFAAAVATHRLLLDAHTGPHLVEVLRDASGQPLMDRSPSLASTDASQREVSP